MKKVVNYFNHKMKTGLIVKEINGFKIKKSINGLGVFAVKNFKKDTTLFEIKGKLITCNDDDNLDEEIRSNTYRFNKDLYLSPKGKMGDFVNHSCVPNAKIIKDKEKLFLVSIRPINRKEEVFFDYSTIIGSDDVWDMKCNCCLSNCRKKIAKFKLLPQKIKKEYLLQGMVPSYILD